MSSLDASQHPATTPSDSSEAPACTEQLLPGLKLRSQEVLEKAQRKGRLKCSKCGGSRMFFCYTCCTLVGVTPEEIPSVKLPLKVDIIKHPNETDGKSTAIHAKILAPSDVTIYTYPCIPDFEKDKVVLVFPGPGAVSVHDMLQCLHDQNERKSRSSFDEPRIKRLKTEDDHNATQTADRLESQNPEETNGLESRRLPLQRVIFIDSTWNQTKKISTDERLQGFLRVELTTRKTCFWRHQKGKPDTYLSTIEAIYYFLNDFHQHCLAQEYNGEYDNLLFFYSYLHSLVNKAKVSAGKC
ncbi:tRNA-uridine aminocarboxypropyltransferase 1 isoform X2 [Antennarius striatus]